MLTWSETMPVNDVGADGSILTSEEAASYLRVSESWLAKARMREDGPAFFPRRALYPIFRSRLVAMD
jgi:hypothetical protein